MASTANGIKRRTTKIFGGILMSTIEELIKDMLKGMLKGMKKNSIETESIAEKMMVQGAIDQDLYDAVVQTNSIALSLMQRADLAAIDIFRKKSVYNRFLILANMSLTIDSEKKRKALNRLITELMDFIIKA